MFEMDVNKLLWVQTFECVVWGEVFEYCKVDQNEKELVEPCSLGVYSLCLPSIKLKLKRKTCIKDRTAENSSDLHKYMSSCSYVVFSTTPTGEDSMNFMKTRSLAYRHCPPSTKISKGIASVFVPITLLLSSFFLFLWIVLKSICLLSLAKST